MEFWLGRKPAFFGYYRKKYNAVCPTHWNEKQSERKEMERKIEKRK